MDIQVLPTTLAAFVEFARTPVSMCSAAIVIFVIALWAARADIAQAGGLDKVGALGNLCFAAPLAVFGALHLSDVKAVLPGVPSYMPWRLFIAYFVGVALLAASLSIATKTQVRWSGLLFGIMMFSMAAMQSSSVRASNTFSEPQPKSLTQSARMIHPLRPYSAGNHGSELGIARTEVHCRFC